MHVEEYKKRHDRVAAPTHWELCKKFEFKHSEKWYGHRAESVLENRSMWDCIIRTDEVIEEGKSYRPDIVLVDKKNKETTIIYVAVSGDFGVSEKKEKICKYQDLTIQVNKMWRT